MKKTLLTFSLAAMVCGMMSAAEPTIYDGAAFCGIAPNGSIAASYVYGQAAIVYVESGTKFEYGEDENVGFGTGNFISNTGVVVGTTNEAAAVWMNGSWTLLDAGSKEDGMALAHGVTRNGSRIVGAVSPDGYDGSHEGLMLVPCYWDLQADGTYGKINYLPYPETDFAGRTPQYITAISVSQDGNTIAGQVEDFSGFVQQPIIYTCKDGEWSYTLLLDEAYHPEGFVLPEDPGDAPNVQPETFMSQEEREEYEAAVEEFYKKQDQLFYPEASQFMSDEEYEAYQKALDEFDGNFENYPEERDYMTDEEWAAYQQAIEEYNEAVASNVYPEYEDYMTEEEWAKYQEARESMDEWDEKWNEFSQAFSELCEIVPSFIFNNVFLTPDGLTYATTEEKGDFMSGYEYAPCIIDIKEDVLTKTDTAGLPLITSSFTDDGTLLAQKPANPMAFEVVVMAYVLPAGSESFETLHSYLASKNATIGKWITDNMTHEVTEFTYDEDADEDVEKVVEVVITGIPFASADMTTIALGVENTWYDWESAEEEYVPAYGYILQSDAWSGVEAAQVGTVGVKAYKGGVIALTGEVASVAVYDLAGHNVFTAAAPEATVNTGLSKGIYIVKAVAADGTATIVKAAF